MRYCPLYIKTDNSLLTSLIKVSDLIEYAKKNGYTYLSIADNTMYGVMDFYKACISNDIKPIVGLELMFNSNKIVLYCMNKLGYRNLNKLYTLSTKEDLKISDLEKYSNDLICILPDESNSLYFTLNKIYKYVFQGYIHDKYEGRNNIYFNEVLFLEKDDYKYYKYLKAIKDTTLVENINTCKDNYFNKIDENNDSDNFSFINSLCNLEIEFNKNLLVKYDDNDPYETLKKLCIDGMKKRFGSSVSRVYLDRLKYELSIIKKMGYCNYFLVVQDYVKYAKEHGILVGPGRGSAAGSLVSYVLFITEIDPIKYNLLFERFLNPERITMPDIDVDFEFNKREEVIRYCMKKYGIKKVAPIITFGTLGSKQVIRDVSRTLDINQKTVDRLSNLIDSKLSLEKNYKSNEKLVEFLNFNKLNDLYKICLKLEGLKRHTSIHAAGVVMCCDEIDEYIPLEYRDNFYVTAYSMDHLEEIGLLKMDFLALRNLTLINDILNNIGSINLDNIPLDDKKTLSIFSSGNTSGIFQFESSGMINFIKKFKPSTFEDVVASLALFRPGPMDNIDSYIRRKQGKEKIDYIHKDLESILKGTYGIIVYQEQIMMIANVMAGYSYGEADVLRRAMSKKKESVLLSEKDKFINQSIKRGYDKEVATKVYDLILKFANYGFNRAHSVAYAKISYQMAYLKAHYTKYFMKELLDMAIGSSYTTKKYIYESILFGVNILPPDINYSSDKYLIENDSIRAPFTIIKNVGSLVIDKIIKERNNKKFNDIFDFFTRTNIDFNIVKNLNDAGCFLSFKTNKKTLDSNLEVLSNYALISSIDKDAPKPILNKEEEYDEFSLARMEYDLFGFYLTKNPIINYRVKNNIMTSLDKVELYFDKVVDLILYVESKKEITTKKGEKMCFLTCSDEIKQIDATIFPAVYKECGDILISSFIKVSARVEKRYDKYQLVILKLEKLKDH